MILKQYYLGCLAHASYLLGDEESATAIIVDLDRTYSPVAREVELQQTNRCGLSVPSPSPSHRT